MDPLARLSPCEGLSTAELIRVLAHYDLGQLQRYDVPSGGFVNWCRVLETSQGRFFFKRRHPALRQPQAVALQHALMGHLRRHGFPAPALVPTRDGGTWLRLGDEVYEVYEYIDGAPYQATNPAHLAAVAATLARYHHLAGTFQPPVELASPRLYAPHGIVARLARLRARWGQDAQCASLLDELQVQATRLAASLPESTYAAFSHCLIHGDFYADNLVFEGHEIVGVFDYDKVSYQARAVEVAEALIYFATTRHPRLRLGVYRGFVDLDRAGRFVRHYCQVLPLSLAERAALPDLMESIWLSVSLQRLLEEEECTWDRAPALLAEARLLSRWIETHGPALRAACGT